ncbi:MAG: hypothetical protein ACFWTY_06365 [Shouchella clausii]
MKKGLSTLFVSLFVVGNFSSAALADSEIKSVVNEFEGTEVINGEAVEYTGVEVTSEEELESTHEFVAFAKAGKRNASVVAKKPLFTDFYATAKSTATYKQNTIGAKVRVLKDDGRSLGSKSDSQKNSTIASATVYPGHIGPTRTTAYGNHTFKRTGFKDWFPETKKTF